MSAAHKMFIPCSGDDPGPLDREEVNRVMSMNKYETIFIINSELDEESIKANVERFKTMIETNGEIESIEEWGNRKLSYLIKDKSEGYYVLVNYSAPPDFPRELERIFRITDSILKFIIIRKDAP